MPDTLEKNHNKLFDTADINDKRFLTFFHYSVKEYIYMHQKNNMFIIIIQHNNENNMSPQLKNLGNIFIFVQELFK